MHKLNYKQPYYLLFMTFSIATRASKKSAARRFIAPYGRPKT